MCDTKVGVLLYTGSETWLFADGDWTCALLPLLPRTELTARARVVLRQQTQGVQPPGRGATALTRFGEGALMFGGESSTGMLGDTWTWTAARGWTELQPSACRRCPDEGSPQNRSMHSLATLTMSGSDGELVILFGGATTGEPRMTALGDTWLLAVTHGSRWYLLRQHFSQQPFRSTDLFAGAGTRTTSTPRASREQRLSTPPRRPRAGARAWPATTPPPARSKRASA